jgi:hypothetical protein
VQHHGLFHHLDRHLERGNYRRLLLFLVLLVGASLLFWCFGEKDCVACGSTFQVQRKLI